MITRCEKSKALMKLDFPEAFEPYIALNLRRFNFLLVNKCSRLPLTFPAIILNSCNEPMDIKFSIFTFISTWISSLNLINYIISEKIT